MEHNAKYICKTVISDKQQNLNTQMAEFGIFMLYVHFGKVQYFFKALKTDFTSQYFFNTLNTAWEPCDRN